MYVNRRDSNGSALIGKKGEDLFLKTMKKRTHIEVEEANYKQQVKEHWDYKIINGDNSLKVDVKAMKRTGRWDSDPQDEIIWIEFQNISGNAGWLYGKADAFAFQCHDGFLFVGRRKLANLCERLVGFKRKEITLENSKRSKGLYKLYNRSDRKDIITQIKKSDIMSIEHNYLRY